MLLSKLLAEGSEAAAVWGVKRDTDSLSVPSGVKEIAFLAEFSNGELSADLMDVVIAYRLEGIHVMIEVPFVDLSKIDAPYLVKMAQCLDASLSLLPPEGDRQPADMERYGQAMAEYANVLLDQRNYIRDLFPVSSYVIYMMSSTVEDMSAFVPTRPYLLGRFHNVLRRDESDAFKGFIRQAVISRFGTEDDFRQYSRKLMGGVLAVATTPQPA